MYLDNTATTKPKQEVIEAMLPYFTTKWYNPSSLYTAARMVKLDMISAKEKIAKFINAEPDEIIFTSCGSESNALALKGCGAKHLITTPIQHKSIMALCGSDYFETVTQISVDNNGKVNEEELSYCINSQKGKTVFAQMYGNNEFGTLEFVNPKANVILHVDATQSFGKVPIDVKAMGVDTLSASGHKIGCPKGIGILYVRRGLKLKPLIAGSQMNGLRGGTENVPYIIGMAKAVELCNVNHNEEMRPLFNYTIEEIKKRKLGNINGDLKDRIFDIVSLTLNENVHGESLVYWLGKNGYYISAGSACNAGSGETSKALKAIGLSDKEAFRTIRITLFDEMTEKDVDKFLDTLEEGIEALKAIRR